eukprot:TRINITY_DN40424_c0_g1_i1.p1 TRINITY_DN40424_c0_g1~~TRINITY_DN40424_c0_g1_i1.p1  ORF type:complete len:371 (+),score=47.21 TRINITY_DN40424_c0_g1_i1:119-1231(+)
MDDSVRSDRSQKLRHRFGVHCRPKVVVHTKQILSKQAKKIAEQAEEHERFINKVTHCLGVLGFGAFCFLLGSRPQDIPYVYCCLFFVMAPLRWIYYRFKKWHYYLLDFCYYANAILMTMVLFFPRSEKLFMICFAFSEGPLAWAIIVWRCSLVFSSLDKIVSVLIHLLPGTVLFVVHWWEPKPFSITASYKLRNQTVWPYVNDDSSLWTWLFFVPLAAYTLWQLSYFLIVNVLRRQRLLRDPEVMTSYRELSKKAQKANNIWWRLSGLLGDQNRVVMYALLQALFTIATMALTVPLFKSYRFHAAFQILKVSAAAWNGGSFLFEVMPKQVMKETKRLHGQISSQEFSECNGRYLNGNIDQVEGPTCFKGS